MALQGKIFDAKLYAGAYDLSGISNTIQLTSSAAALDATAMGNTTKVNYVGIKEFSLAAAGHFSTPSASNLLDATLFSNLDSTTIPVTYMPTNTPIEGSIAFFFSAAQPSYTPPGGAHGVMAPYQFNAVPGSLGYPLIRGFVLEPGSTARTETGTGTGFVVGAAAASQHVYAALHVFGASAGDTLDVIIKSDADGNFAAGATTRFTFTQAAGITSQMMILDGAITDTYYRVEYTIAGTEPSFNFAVVVGVAA